MQKFFLVVLWVGQRIVMTREQDRDGSQCRRNTYQKNCLKITFTACVLVVFWKGRIDMCSRKGSVYLKIYEYF